MAQLEARKQAKLAELEAKQAKAEKLQLIESDPRCQEVRGRMRGCLEGKGGGALGAALVFVQDSALGAASSGVMPATRFLMS